MGKLVYFTGDIALVDNLSIEDCMAIQEPLKKLHEYEIAEEQGLLLRLPYTIGTPIYKVVYSSKLNDGFVYETTMSLKYYADDIKAFEKGLVYSDKEEAEQKLAEMKEGAV